MSSKYPIKSERLQQLYDAGFNIADFVCFPIGKLDEAQLRSFLEKHGRISCRHFHPDEKTHFKCPVIYDQDNFENILAFCREHNQRYYTLCNQALKLSDSIYAGNILIRDVRNYSIEFFEGKGTPRDLESKNSSEIIYFEREFGKPMPANIPLAIQNLRVNLSKFIETLEVHPVIIEFSIYPYGVGRRGERSICWEWRQGWLHYAMEHNINLLAENQALRSINHELEIEIQFLRSQLDEKTA